MHDRLYNIVAEHNRTATPARMRPTAAAPTSDLGVRNTTIPPTLQQITI
jgi:hypothetical protein